MQILSEIIKISLKCYLKTAGRCRKIHKFQKLVRKNLLYIVGFFWGRIFVVGFVGF